jgi:hypothetical protein
MEQKDSISITIPKSLLEKNTSCALSYIDYYGNESDATILNKNTVTKTYKSLSHDENR